MATDTKTPETMKVLDVTLPSEIFDVQTNVPLIHQVVVARHHHADRRVLGNAAAAMQFLVEVIRTFDVFR